MELNDITGKLLCDDSEIDLEGNIHPDINGTARNVTLNLLPQKSRDKYERQYEMFQSWCSENNIQEISENVLIAYFDEKYKLMKSSTAWSVYSMLKATIQIKIGIDISVYKKLVAFLKQSSVGYKPNRSKTLSKDEIVQFLKKAPDSKYLLKKVILIFGIAGGCRRNELKNMTIHDVEDKESMIIVKIPDTETKNCRVFTISNDDQQNVDYLSICRKYFNLRPSNIFTPRLFLRYNNGVCVKQVVGTNWIAKIPKDVATFLKLEDPSLYTGTCFRRTSATLLVEGGGDLMQLKYHGGWKSSTIARKYIDESIRNKIVTAKKILGQPLVTPIVYECPMREDSDDDADNPESEKEADFLSENEGGCPVDRISLPDQMNNGKGDNSFSASFRGKNKLLGNTEQSPKMELELPEVPERPAGVMADTLDHFGKYVASILRELPIDRSYNLQRKFISEAIWARQIYEKQQPSEFQRKARDQNAPTYTAIPAQTATPVPVPTPAHIPTATATPKPTPCVVQPVTILTTSSSQSAPVTSPAGRHRKRRKKNDLIDASTSNDSTSNVLIKEEVTLDDTESETTRLSSSEQDDLRIGEGYSCIEIGEEIKREYDGTGFEVVYCASDTSEVGALESAAVQLTKEPKEEIFSDPIPGSSTKEKQMLDQSEGGVTEPHTSNGKFHCKMCSIKFPNYGDFWQHAREKHAGIFAPAAVQPPTPPRPPEGSAHLPSSMSSKLALILVKSKQASESK